MSAGPPRRPPPIIFGGPNAPPRRPRRKPNGGPDVGGLALQQPQRQQQQAIPGGISMAHPLQSPVNFPDGTPVASPSTAATNFPTSSGVTIREKQINPPMISDLPLGRLTIRGKHFDQCTPADLADDGLLGEGSYGVVTCKRHKQSDTRMAVKRIHYTVDEREQRRLLMDLDVVKKSTECPYIVQFYGCLFAEGDVWICMELMGTSMDKWITYIFKDLQSSIPENILGKIGRSVVLALDYLKEQIKIIHRDVKPSNILVDREGHVKLCDFGISGYLVDSIAITKDVGCRPYMAPERICPQEARDGTKGGYDIRSDVWSLGITLLEMALGRFPYRPWDSVFEQLDEVVNGAAPRLDNHDKKWSEEMVDFVAVCLTKNYEDRPKYREGLLAHPWLVRFATEDVDTTSYFTEQALRLQSCGISIAS
ncbi:dual specificity mitogen-activated protein kinase kinase 6-like isoform X2 [Sycon ciliatum]|uniref:dual specificity mitogen-activated protein kinase kinase 6-like isoform X2 n=1 Tax=Sycon ciliatum TaxID=27933 RepID=UPI0031F65C99